MVVKNKPNSMATSSNSKMYKGVRKRKWGKWVSEIRLPNSRERIWLGSYDTQEKAARAFDAALFCLRGRNASFNFPDTPLNFEESDCHSLSHHEIQEVAQKFANEVASSSSPIESYENNNNNNNNSQEGEGEGDEEEDGANSSLGLLFEANSNNNNDPIGSSNDSTTTTTTSLFSPLYDYDGSSMQVDNGGDIRAMDWTFLNMLDHDDSNYNNIGVDGYDFGLYCGLDKVQSSGEFLYSTPQPTIFEDSYNGEEIHQGDDAFSYNHSFLWSWNF